MSFKVGDRVVCVIDIDGEGRLRRGEIYTVDDFNGTHVKLKEHPHRQWLAYRFKPDVSSGCDTDVHCGGPYVASSVYEQVLKQRDAALEAVAAHQKEIRELKAQLTTTSGQLAPLSQPDPPKWLRPGWWYAMDRDGEWWIFPDKPTVSYDTAEWSLDGCGVCAVKIQDTFWLADMNLIPSRKTPTDRWREACWQVKE